MPRGGARPGAGRKRGPDKFPTAFKQAEKRIAERLPKLIDSLFDLAEGVRVMETSITGAPVVYVKPPDFKAASYLVDRVMGKPVQSVNAEHSGEGGGAIRIRVEYDDADPRLHDHAPAATPGPADGSE